MKQTATPTPLDSTIPFPTAQPDAHSPAAGGQPDKARRGRPTLCTPQVLSMMKDVILRNGFSDTAAAESVGMSSTTISRWKKKDPEIAAELQKTRQGCRLYHFEKILQHAESETMRGLRASMWILERLFPGDYSPKMSERFEYRTLEDQRKDREDRDLVYDDVRLRKEDERAATEEARQAAARESEAPVENSCSPSEDDSRNSRNAEDAASEIHESGRPRPEVPPNTTVSNSERGGSDSLAAAAENSCVYSEGDSHISRNSGADRPAEAPAGAPHPQQAAASTKRQQAAAVQGGCAAEEGGSAFQGRSLTPDWSPLLKVVSAIPENPARPWLARRTSQPK